jgi:hypothetical protein
VEANLHSLGVRDCLMTDRRVEMKVFLAAQAFLIILLSLTTIAASILGMGIPIFTSGILLIISNWKMILLGLLLSRITYFHGTNL